MLVTILANKDGSSKMAIGPGPEDGPDFQMPTKEEMLGVLLRLSLKVIATGDAPQIVPARFIPK